MTRAHALALGWCAVIVGLASLPGDRVPEPLLWSTDSVRHALAFALIVVLWLRAEPARPGRVVAGAVAFGIAVELWQGLPFIGRTASAVDVVADAVGVGLGFGAWTLARGVQSPHTKAPRGT